MEHAPDWTTKLVNLVSSLDRKTDGLIVQVAETGKRLGEMEKKLGDLGHFREKFLEWMGQYSRRFEDLRAFREESRASLEAVYCKLEDLDQDVRLLKAAVRDVDRRYETLKGSEPTARPSPQTALAKERRT